MFEILLILVSIIGAVSGIYGIFHFFVALFGFKNPEQIPLNAKKNHKFTAIISARNEENVISGVVRSLKEQDYPQHLLDVIVIADNCTDKTALVAKEAGAIVFERNQPDKAMKGYALEWLIDQLLADENFDSDAVFVFDADNIADKNFVSRMNVALDNGSQMAQGYRDSKNPFDNSISGAYSIYFLTLMRFFMLARKNLGISSFIGGTGFMLSTELLRKCGGWHTKEICEDVEFTMYRLGEGVAVDFIPDAIFFDEQPVTFSQSWHQRVRWTTGNWNCIKTCMPILSKSKNIKFSDRLAAFMHLMTVPSMLAGFASMVLSILLMFFAEQYLIYSILSFVLSLILGAVAMIFEAVLVLALEKKDILANIKGILGFPIFVYTFLVINFVGVVKPAKTWRPVIHGKKN